jgi:hypothetical protein
MSPRLGAEDDFFFWLLADFLVRPMSELLPVNELEFLYPEMWPHLLGPLPYMDTSQMTSFAKVVFMEDFNEDISRWDVSNVEDMSFLFYNQQVFNQPLETWNVGNVRSMVGMFRMTGAFNQPLGKWDVSNVEDFADMFAESKAFRQSLQEWKNLPDGYLFCMFQDAVGYIQPDF